MITTQEKSLKQITRNSLECIDCIHDENCKSQYGLSVFEHNNKAEIDCWLKQINKFIFFTGLHKPMFLNIGDKKYTHKWLHGIDERFDVISENYLRN